MSKMIYVASPYWHEDPLIRDMRFRFASLYCAEKMMKMPELMFFSPITYGHIMAQHAASIVEQYPGCVVPDEAKWLQQSLHFLISCAAIHVLMVDGWQLSKGVRREIDTAQKLSIPVHYIKDPSYVIEHY